MVRTQIRLSKEEHAAAKEEARRLGISLAELLRRSLRQMLPPDETKPWMRHAGMVASGDPNASQRIDEFIHLPAEAPVDRDNLYRALGDLPPGDLATERAEADAFFDDEDPIND